MTLFARQSVLAKSLLTLMTLVAGLLATLSQSLLLLALGGVFLLVQPRLLLDWLRLLARLAPMFILLLLFGLASSIPFPVQALMLSRIALLLLASVWLARTSRLERLVAELRPLRRIPLVHDGLWYLVGTLLWLPVIGEELRRRREQATSWRETPRILVDALAAAMTRMDEIEASAEAALAADHPHATLSPADLLLLVPVAAGMAVLLLF